MRAAELKIYGTRGKMNNLMQCCLQLVAMLCCTLSNNVVLHPVLTLSTTVVITTTIQQPFTVVHVQQPLFSHC